MANTDAPSEDGFEIDGQFYRWHVTDSGKDLMLIDRFTGMPIPEFFETIEDDFDRGRAPIVLALIATSIRNRFPDWSVERIVRKVMNTSLGDVEFIDTDTEEAPPGPPAEAGREPDTKPSVSQSADSKQPSSEPAPAISETSSVTPAFSGLPG